MKYIIILVVFFTFTNISFAQNAPLEGTEEGIKLEKELEEKKPTHLRDPASTYVMKSPLYVIDGVTVEPDFFGDQIKPKCILGIKVLKEKAATAVYGTSGENGVIVITLKKKYAKKFKKMMKNKKE